MSKYIENYVSKFNSSTLTLVGPLLKTKSQFSEPVIFIDGGANYKRNDSLGISVGDGDSFDGVLNEILPQEKDYSDLSYVLNNCTNKYDTVKLYGFLGGRRDHELINFGEVINFLNRQSIKSKVEFDNEVTILSSGEWHIEVQGVFSLLSFVPQHISIVGACKYQLTNAELKPMSSHGLSNIGNGLIEIKCDSPIMVCVVRD